MKLIDRLRAQSVSKLVLIVSLIVALVPVGFLGYHVYHAAWEDAWREIREKHQLLAQNLAAPIATYVTDHRDMLAMMGESLGMMSPLHSTTAAKLLERSVSNLHGFENLVLLDLKGNVLASAHHDSAGTPIAGRDQFSTERCYLTTRESGAWSLSRIKPHPVDGTPSVFMGQPVIDADGRMQGVLLGELRIDLIEQLRRKVKFGEKGHSAIVDQTGHVIAHPNPQWMAEMRDISSWPIVQNMTSGKTGVTTFYSPFMKGDMVAGYAAVPEIGWGIMVPQPKAEVAAQVNALMRSHVIWGVAGLVLAILLALIIARWITRPLNRLASAGQDLMAKGLQGSLPEVQPDSPREVRELGWTLTALVSGLQQSRQEINTLNESLQAKVDAATRQLRESNQRLEQAARVDHLTALANRRHFETSLSKALSRRRGDVDNLCILLIDIDHFKQINDYYGHAGGDAVLNHVARILERQMRAEDLVARYGGDEFVAHMRCSREVGLERAQQIRQTIEHCGIPWKDKTIHITASIGLYCQQLDKRTEINELLLRADHAMYHAKKKGRNKVVDVSG